MSSKPVNGCQKIFLLSPANCGGIRAGMIMSAKASFPLAQQMRGRAGAPLGDIFSFVSGLYFRGKLAYARRFASPPDPGDADVVRRHLCDYAERRPAERRRRR